MSVVAYLRVSTDKQDVRNQRFEIARFCEAKGWSVSSWVSETVSGTKELSERRLGVLLPTLGRGDTLVISEISRLSRRMYTVMNILGDLISKGVEVYTVKDGFAFKDDINSQVMAFAFGLAADIERRLLSSRTKEGLARRKADGVRLGRPPGVTRPTYYKLHGKDRTILRYMDKRLSVAAMARLLNVNRNTMKAHIDRQGLHEQLRWKRLKQTGD